MEPSNKEVLESLFEDDEIQETVVDDIDEDDDLEYEESDADEESETEEADETGDDDGTSEEDDQGEREEGGEEGTEEESEDLDFTFGDDEPEDEEKPEDSAVIRKLRKQNRHLKKQLKSQAKPEQAEEQLELGPKPTLRDHDYDTDAHDKALDEWYAKKAQVEQQQAKARQAQQKLQEDWQNRINAYSAQKEELGVDDVDDVEDIVRESLNEVQQSIIIKGAEQSAKLIYALGKNPKQLKAIASITDPVEFAFAAARLEGKMQPRSIRKAPPPEKKVGTVKSGGGANAVSNKLAKLRKEASETGDFTKLNQYKQKLRKKG